jgi:hypothetical protein
VNPARPLRASSEDGAVVAEPPLAEAGRLVALNRQRLVQLPADLLGRSFAELRQAARQSVLAAARAYLQLAGEPLPPTTGLSLLMAGHQPDLFHPGVWVKNFALNSLARKTGAVPVNLVVDNDTVKSTALYVPSLDDPPRRVRVAFDQATTDVPYEERAVVDEELFASFPERMPAGWGFDPILPAFWNTVLQQQRRTALLGERLAAARREWERRWGCHNLEVPVSHVCQTEPFAWFASHLLAALPRFHAIYNECLHSHRHEHRIRSRQHPAPDLSAEGDWLEAPFWARRLGDVRRGRLMARHRRDRIELRVGETKWPTLPLGQPDRAWSSLERDGFMVRPRALTNTLYARVFLCDLFIHGIGGGLYDEVTNAIIQRFYGIEPPAFLVLSTTLLLPFARHPGRPDECRRLARELRDLHWNPQRHISLDGAAAKLALQKQAWINQQPDDRNERRERFRVLRELTDHLRQYTGEREAQVRRELASCQREVQANDVLRRRDYAFCLYPEAPLREFCRRFL